MNKLLEALYQWRNVNPSNSKNHSQKGFIPSAVASNDVDSNSTVSESYLVDAVLSFFAEEVTIELPFDVPLILSWCFLVVDVDTVVVTVLSFSCAAEIVFDVGGLAEVGLVAVLMSLLDGLAVDLGLVSTVNNNLSL